jgi:c-di-GMP-binding flagellar brake protein YcgR
MSKESERRKHKRIKRHFIVKLHIRSEAKPKEEENNMLEDWEMVTLQDMSAGGALFNYNKKLEENTLVDLKIEFPATKDTVNCVGKVLRVFEAPMKPLYRVAVEFVEISEKDRNMVNRLAEELFLKHPDKFDYRDKG